MNKCILVALSCIFLFMSCDDQSSPEIDFTLSEDLQGSWYSGFSGLFEIENDGFVYSDRKAADVYKLSDQGDLYLYEDVLVFDYTHIYFEDQAEADSEYTGAVPGWNDLGVLIEQNYNSDYSHLESYRFKVNEAKDEIELIGPSGPNFLTKTDPVSTIPVNDLDLSGIDSTVRNQGGWSSDDSGIYSLSLQVGEYSKCIEISFLNDGTYFKNDDYLIRTGTYSFALENPVSTDSVYVEVRIDDADGDSVYYDSYKGQVTISDTVISVSGYFYNENDDKDTFNVDYTFTR